MKQRISNAYHQLRKTNILANFFNLGSIQISNILLLLLTIRLITGVVGIEEFGIVMFANRVAQFAGIAINFGTNQSAVRDTASNLDNPQQLASVFYNTIWIRALVFIATLTLLLCLHNAGIPYYNTILMAMPIVLAEVFNPLCFFIGIEKLKVFNVYNLIFNAIAVLALVCFIKGPADANWINFILGAGNVITYVGLLIYLLRLYKLSFRLPVRNEIMVLLKANFHLTVNNVSVNLQQSVIVFALANWGSAYILGAYTLCDRVIGQCRNLLITLSNAIYPNAVHAYNADKAHWHTYRRKTKYLLAGAFFVAAILLFALADFIICPILSNQPNPTAVLFLRIMAFVPLVSAFNVLNVLDQLLKNNTVYIFRIATILLVLALALAFMVVLTKNQLLIGAFTLIIELAALLMYEYCIKKPALQDA
ncbi:oligosaccharide flippase family protein [Mucilaginibacter panaciglaebae]|uniref:oligosaccharide flippase family protein n=1 Tax=Mucilaginibacter panaciglaebae TaxID=502331 RepID=UPI0031F0BB6F